MNAFIHVGVKFRGFAWNGRVVGLYFRGSVTFSIFAVLFITIRCVFKFVDKYTHEINENWNPTKINEFTVSSKLLVAVYH